MATAIRYDRKSLSIVTLDVHRRRGPVSQTPHNTMGRRMREFELRELEALLKDLLEDSELLAQLSVIESRDINGALAAVRSMLAIVRARGAEDFLSDG